MQHNVGSRRATKLITATFGALRPAALVLSFAIAALLLIGCTHNAARQITQLQPTAPPLIERTLDNDVMGWRPQHVVMSLGAATVEVTYDFSTATSRHDFKAATIDDRRALRLVYRLQHTVLFDRVIGSDPVMSLALVGTHSARNPLVVFKTYSGGTHCCTVSQIVDVETDTDIHVREDNWADGDFSIRRGTVTKDPVLLGREPAATYTFGDFAGTAFIVRVEKYDRGELRDAAKAYPELVLADARERLNDYLQEGSGDHPIGKSSLAGFLIDMCRVGRCGEGWKKVRDLYGDDSDRDKFFTSDQNLLSVEDCERAPAFAFAFSPLVRQYALANYSMRRVSETRRTVHFSAVCSRSRRPLFCASRQRISVLRSNV